MASELEKQFKRQGMTEASAAAKVLANGDGLVDMKRTKAEKKAEENKYKVSSSSSGEEYPYGLQLDLNEDVMRKLGMDLPKVGGTVTITAKARVKRAEMRDTESGKNTSCCLQITKLKVS